MLNELRIDQLSGWIKKLVTGDGAGKSIMETWQFIKHDPMFHYREDTQEYHDFLKCLNSANTTSSKGATLSPLNVSMEPLTLILFLGATRTIESKQAEVMIASMATTAMTRSMDSEAQTPCMEALETIPFMVA